METPQSQSFQQSLRLDFEQIHSLSTQVQRVIVGQDSIINAMLTAIVCNSHVLIEGVPGIAKTTLIKVVAQSLGLQFKRIQFTPDLLPADLIGTLIYNPKTQEFETKKGPIFANIILADEINRAPAKVQSALLEAMQEHQVTIGSQTFKLEEPFLVFATQNPIEQEGTYQLPEAQLDRFMFKLLMSYPTHEQEYEILKRSLQSIHISPALHAADIMRVQESVKHIYVDEKIARYIVDIVCATRNPQAYALDDIARYIRYGASPRATLALNHGCRAHAFLQQRHFVIPDDVKAVCTAVMRHRLLLTYEAEAENITADYLIAKIIRSIPTP